MVNLSNTAPQVGFAATVFTTLMGVIGFFGNSMGVGIYTFIVGLAIMPLEAPILCGCMPSVQGVMLEQLKMNNWLFRGVTYILLTVIAFMGDVWSVLGGTALFVCGILYIVAQAQGLREPDGDLGENAPIV